MIVTSKELRRRARASLQGEYAYALLATVIFSTLSSVAAAIVGGLSGARATMRILERGIDVMNNPGEFFSVYIQSNPLSFALTLVNMILVCPLSIGLVSYYIHIADRDAPNLGQLFTPYRFFWNAVGLELLIGVFVFLWSLLLIIPGIIASLRYAMAPYILAEHPDMKPSQALNLSKQMMKGNCGRLFCLHLSFIGWALLSILTLGIGFFFLTPYVNTSAAEFFNEVSGKNYQKAQAAAQAAPYAPTPAPDDAR